jgi:hypothetical protein
MPVEILARAPIPAPTGESGLAAYTSLQPGIVREAELREIEFLCCDSLVPALEGFLCFCPASLRAFLLPAAEGAAAEGEAEEEGDPRGISR